MAHTESTKKGSFARDQAREIVQRQRETQDRLQRIETLKSIASVRFKRLNRTIVMSFVWIIVLCVAFGAIGWYWNDVVDWIAALFTPSPPPKGP